jgi:hypothetical protein
VTTDRIQYENLAEGKYVSLLTEDLTVQIFGTSADVRSISGEDVLVIADLQDFAAASGTYTVPARILVNTSKDIGVSGTYQVQVNISREPLQSEEPDTPTEEETNTGELP